MSSLGLQGGKIRDTLFQILEKEDDVIIKHGAQSRESRRAASQGMHTSKFCLHPAGDTPSACRLFDAIVSLCIPVIVSDSIELPFEDTIDYRKIAVFVETATAIKPGYLVSILRGITPDRVLEYQKELKEVSIVLLALFTSVIRSVGVFIFTALSFTSSIEFFLSCGKYDRINT
jgi:hypothetical protein